MAFNIRAETSDDFEEFVAPYFVFEEGGFLILLDKEDQGANIVGIINLNKFSRVDIEKIDGVH